VVRLLKDDSDFFLGRSLGLHASAVASTRLSLDCYKWQLSLLAYGSDSMQKINCISIKLV
jgi:hypothetical protein